MEWRLTGRGPPDRWCWSITVIAFAVTVIFNADVDAQGGAYATGVLVLMTSAAIAVTLSVRRRRKRWWPFLLIALVFVYTTIQNIHERPEGIKIASFFILAIIVSSLFRACGERLSSELSVLSWMIWRVSLYEEPRPARFGSSPIVATQATRWNMKSRKERSGTDNHIPAEDPVIFFEVTPSDASEFSGVLRICGEHVDGFRVLRSEYPAVPNAIAAFLLFLRNETGKLPHVYFGWSEGNRFRYLMKYIAFGEGDTAPVTHEVLRQAEKNPERRPVVHVGG